ncbi:hypothetical protein M9Y10_041763 [Tritrichomonas musculus]|uniref:Uncharacterized protein n=1 Tax=Tritrichomonas musculus TaxID=1915356 RepID=A0ABR2K5A7_9EUKA
MTSNDLEITTVELLSRSWEEIYGVLATFNDAVKSRLDSTKQLLISKPAFARALFQAQLELGIANLDSETEAPKVEEDEYQLLERVKSMTKEEFDKLQPEAQKYVKQVRESLQLPPVPIE